MEPSSSTWRWTCPHCGVGSMTLGSAARHLRRKHYDCPGCRVERHMVAAMAEGLGFIVAADDPLHALFSRPESPPRSAT